MSTDPPFDRSAREIDVCAVRKTNRWIGAYLLHMRFHRPADVQVGRRNGGKPLCFPSGDYVYVGSAMGHNSGRPLPRRLVRHATRSGTLPDHSYRTVLLSHFERFGLSSDLISPLRPKRLHWNVDFILDHRDIELRHVLYVCSERAMEQMIAERLESHPSTSAPFPGLGANDHYGHTHLLMVEDRADPWDRIVGEFKLFLESVA